MTWQIITWTLKLLDTECCTANYYYLYTECCSVKVSLLIIYEHIQYYLDNLPYSGRIGGDNVW